MPPTMTAPNRVPRALAAAAASALVLTSVAVGAAAPAAAATHLIPVEIGAMPYGTFLPVVEITINGSDPLRVMLDTGSSGLVIFPDRIQNPTTPPTSTDAAVHLNYNSNSVDGTVASGMFEIAGAASVAPVNYTQADSCDPHCQGQPLDLDGLMGVSQGLKEIAGTGGPFAVYSPLLQLDAELVKGMTFDLTSGSGSTLQLGEPVTGGPDQMVLQRTAIDGTYPNGLPRYNGLPNLCLLIGTEQLCAQTAIDSGELIGMVMGSVFAPYVNPIAPSPLSGGGIVQTGIIKGNTTVGIAQGEGDRPFMSFIPTEMGSTNWGFYTSTGSNLFNTGNMFFLHRTVAYDSATGEIIVGGSDAVPSAPRDLTVTPEPGAVELAWHHPDEAGVGDITAMVVTARNLVHPKSVATLTLPADAERARVPLPAGEYVVEVAASNAYGLGTPATSRVRVDGLAATGSPLDPRPPLALAALAALLGVALIGAARRSSPHSARRS